MKSKSDKGRRSKSLRVAQVFAAQAHECVVYPILIENALDIGIVRKSSSPSPLAVQISQAACDLHKTDCNLSAIQAENNLRRRASRKGNA
jgi:hypothetical protein